MRWNDPRTLLILLAAVTVSHAFGTVRTTTGWGPIHFGHTARTTATQLQAAIGIIYGTSTGSTQTAAVKIYEAFGSEWADEPIDVDQLENGQLASLINSHNALVVGTPTWNTGAESERSGTGWDEIYYSKLPELRSALQGKKVAVFGLGDQVSYAENYADATGELFDVFEGLGCRMLGSWSMEGYEHEASKSIRGDKFCGLLLDLVNQEDLTDERVEQWVAQLKEEGILEGGGSGGTARVAVPAAKAQPVTEAVNGLAPAPVQQERVLEENSRLLDQSIGSHSSGGFTPHFNPVKGTTMWTSADGRNSFVTTEKPKRLNP